MSGLAELLLFKSQAFSIFILFSRLSMNPQPKYYWISHFSAWRNIYRLLEFWASEQKLSLPLESLQIELHPLIEIGSPLRLWKYFHACCHPYSKCRRKRQIHIVLFVGTDCLSPPQGSVTWGQGRIAEPGRGHHFEFNGGGGPFLPGVSVASWGLFHSPSAYSWDSPGRELTLSLSMTGHLLQMNPSSSIAILPHPGREEPS